MVVSNDGLEHGESQGAGGHVGKPHLKSHPSKTLEGLGRIRYVFRPDIKNLLAGIILGCAMICGGIAMVRGFLIELQSKGWSVPWYADKGLCWTALIFLGALASAITVGGSFLLRWAVGHCFWKVTICDAGFQWRTWRATRQYLWEDVQLVRESIFGPRSPNPRNSAGDPTFSQTVREYRIFLNDGLEIHLTANSLRGHSTFGYICQMEAIGRGVPTETLPKRDD